MPEKLCKFVKHVPLVLILNTVPTPQKPPPPAVPYRVLPDKINPASDPDPSLLAIKLCRFVKPVPSVLIPNTVPAPELPPSDVVPYRVLPDIVKPPAGPAPSLLV